MAKLYLNDTQLKAEILRCLNCKNKPCMLSCPVNCSPQEFIEKAKQGDFQGAIDIIRRNNPMGQTCGLICPEYFCKKACVRSNIDMPVNIPKIQATIMEKYASSLTPTELPPFNGKKIAVIGAGPAGMAAAHLLGAYGYEVMVFEAQETIGGALNLIPDRRLPHSVIEKDWAFISKNPRIKLNLKSGIQDPQVLLKDFNGVIVASGEPKCINLGVEGEEYAIAYTQYLRHPEAYLTSEPVAIIGGGSVATDCALTAKHQGAIQVEMFVRRRLSDMRITSEEREDLLQNQVDISTMTRVCKIEFEDNLLTLTTCKTQFKDTKLIDIPNTFIKRPGFKYVIKSIGSTAERKSDSKEIVYAGDCKHGGSTIVEALASGKEAGELLHKNISQ